MVVCQSQKETRNWFPGERAGFHDDRRADDTCGRHQGRWCSQGQKEGSGLVWCPPGIRRYIPLLASPQGGVAASSKKFRGATEADAAGVVFLFVSIGKPPRPRDQRMLRDILLIARPPLLAVMQGGKWPLRNVRTFFTSSN